MIAKRSEKELKYLREAGQILAGVLKELEKTIMNNPGITTFDLNKLAESLILKQKAKPAFKGYRGFPYSLCVSLNEEVVHGIPGPRQIRPGDIVSLDLGVNWKGYYSDAAITVPIGKVSREVRKLLKVTKMALYKGIKQARRGKRVSDISFAIQHYVEKNGFSVVKDLTGHGIGRKLHEEPAIPNFGEPGHGPQLEEGMVLAIEPMVNMGNSEVEILKDHWTIVTKDRQLSAHFEHTVAVTNNHPEILTLYNTQQKKDLS
ncbi:type I methionyl aminopeptidase [Candidatus Aerophobetes bacterium]|nr:type I methionyl aminopeptidase [Candidatus Aerophobetes bacterium]